jgi:glutathione S-transferase
MFDSPFVRRVAVSMKMLDVPFQHSPWSVGRDFDRIRQYNPLGRVPALVLDEGEVLFESGAILDYLDEQVGPKRALLPIAGRDRREAWRLIALALGAAEKGREQVYESGFRPEDKRHAPWVDRCRMQMDAALVDLARHCERRGPGRWLIGPTITQADITVACAFTFLCDALQIDEAPPRYASLAAFVNRCEGMPEFRSTYAPFVAPGVAQADVLQAIADNQR